MHNFEPPDLEHNLVNNPVDLTKFAKARWWTGTQRHDLVVHPLARGVDGTLLPAQDLQSGTWHWGLEWTEPRDIRQVVVVFLDEPPKNVQVQYWQNTWPTPVPERLPGARRGWIGCDDPWHGQWVTVRAEETIEGNTWSFAFDPIDLPELRGVFSSVQLEHAEHYLVRFRRTLKIRVVCIADNQPRMKDIHVYSDSRWLNGEIDISFGIGSKTTEDWSGWVEGINGIILDITPLNFDHKDGITGNNRWQCNVSQKTAHNNCKGIRLRVHYADCNVSSGDRTTISLHTQTKSFSFLINDLHRGPIYIKDYGVYISWRNGPSFDVYKTQLTTSSRTIYERITQEPEHSLERAMREIPPLDVVKQNSYTGLGRYLPLSVEAGRQEFALRHNGELFADKEQLKLEGRDAAHLLWPGHQIRFHYGTGDPPNFRESDHATRQTLMDGWLPVVVSQWLDREIEVEQTTFVALLDGPVTNPELRKGDENIVAMQRFTLRNTTSYRKTAKFWVVISPQEFVQLEDEKIISHGRVVPAAPVNRQWHIARYEVPRLRSTVSTGGRGTLQAVPFTEDTALSQAIPSAILYSIRLNGSDEHTIYINTPFVTLIHESDWDKVVDLDYDAKLNDVVSYWRGYVGSGGQILVPDTILNDFHKAARVHVAIGVDKDPESGLYVVPAATWSYGACGNEATWQISMLEQAGHHDRAEAYLETFLQTQGLTRPDGLFSSAEGALLAMNIDAGIPQAGGFGYNLDHGYIMECLANHYLYTRDDAWLARVTPNLIAACDFVIRERQRTKIIDGTGQRESAWGLLPAGHLEDNPEWRHWFAVNAHAYAGMHTIARILAETGHPEEKRLKTETELYRQDIRKAVRHAIAASPVVQLLDGSYIPHVPTRTGIRGREWGWFREAAYGALHLMEGYAFDPGEEEMTWVLKDLEDNLFVSREWGRPVDLEEAWFSHGGVTIQPNLMDLGIDYLRRGQIKHALRALFNNFGVSLYGDVRTFTEHPVVELGHGVGPFYKSPDECKALIWLRHFLLHEEGDALHVAMGTPRAWFAPGESFSVHKMASLLGRISYQINSTATTTTVDIILTENHHINSLIVHLRLPVGKKIRAVTLNDKAFDYFDPSNETITITDVEENLYLTVNYV